MKNFSYSLFKNIALLSSLEICVSCSNNNSVNKHNQDNVKTGSSEDADAEITFTSAENDDETNLAEIGVINSVVVLEDKNITPEEDSENEKVENLNQIENFRSRRANVNLKKNDSKNLYISKNKFVFQIIQNGRVKIVCLDVDENFQADYIDVPEKVLIDGNFYLVTSIGKRAFRGCKNIKHINLPSSISNIGNRVFENCTSLTSISILQKVRVIGDCAFANTCIKNIFIPKSVRILGKNAFCSDTIENIFLETGSRLKESDILNALGNRWNGKRWNNEIIDGKICKVWRLRPIETRESCNGNSVNKNNQDNVKDGSSMNGNNTNHTGKRRGENSIEPEKKKNPVEEDGENEKVKNLNQIEKFKTTRVVNLNQCGSFRRRFFTAYNSEKLYSSTDNFVFRKTLNIGSVELVCLDVEKDFKADNINVPRKVRIEGYTYLVTNIGDKAFHGCKNIKHVNLPLSISYICEYAFEDCENLESVSFYGNEEIVVSDGNNFSVLEELKQRASKICDIFFSKSNDESKLAQLQEEASKIRKIKFENSKDTLGIDYCAFKNCKNLKKISIPKGVTKIGDFAFFLCNSLESISITDGVETIGNSAFENCTNLTEVSLDRVETIGNSAFENCTNLTEVSLDRVETIGDSAFENCGLTKISIPEGVETIGNSAFKNCTNLSEISLNGVKTIGNSAFENCGLTKISIPEGVETIGNSAFKNCTNLSEISLNGVIVIGSRAFKNTGVKKILIPESVKKVKKGAFDTDSIEEIIFKFEKEKVTHQCIANACARSVKFFRSNFDDTIFKAVPEKK